jgi:Ribonuclease G/E
VLRLMAARSPGELRVALLRDDQPVEFYIHRPGAPDGFGDLHWARVLARVPAMAGTFVALAGATGFLPDSEGGAGASVGDHLAVRVTRAAQGQKGPRVSARLSDTERALGGVGAVRLLAPGPSPLAELATAFPDAELCEGDWPPALEAEIDDLAEATIALPVGMRGSISPTPALTAIDLDSAAATAARTPKPAAQAAANLACLPELARQIAVRNLSGAILVDFSGLATRKRATLLAPLAAALATDRLCPRVAGISALGFAEIMRPRGRPPLHEVLAGPHAAGLAALRRARAENAAGPARRLALRASPAVVAALRDDAAALVELARDTTYPLLLCPDPALPGFAWSIEDIRA